MEQNIVDLMKQEVYKPLSAEELFAELGFKDFNSFQEQLNEMERKGKVIKTRKMKYGLPENMNLAVGRLQGHSNGYGFVIQDTPGIPDVFISSDKMNGAMHNDRVVARLTGKGWNGPRQEGEIIRILERANQTVVGTMDRGSKYGFVTPDEKRISKDIFIPNDQANGASTGDKVVVEITEWPVKRRNPEGKVIQIIGKLGDPGTDIQSIIWKYGLPKSFPQKVLDEIPSISMAVTEDQIKGRLDIRNLQMVTIDGEDAKDLDDAVSLEMLPDGNYRLGVHIADVGHYVPMGSPLDKEAFKRGTSVYLVDRVIPMLPPELSNGICSLNPQVDRLAMTVLMEIDREGKVNNYSMHESVININERMTYTNVTKILVNKDQELCARYKDLLEMFRNMEDLSRILRSRRYRRGSVDFDFPEVKVKLDSQGKPVDIVKYPRGIADEMIEEFMLVTNETVAEHFSRLEIPFVYRIHENPDGEKLANLNKFLFTFGLTLRGLNKIHPGNFQEILAKVKGRPEERVISTVMLRTMKLAKYSSVNAGHFGLAAEDYSHFTSPIRRYPDLTIHRIMKEWLANGQVVQQKLTGFVEAAAVQSSETERIATEAERESVELKKVEYMADKVGQEYPGIISGVTAFGFFVELDNLVEGLVHVTTLQDDFYEFDEVRMSLIGLHTKRTFRIGDQVKVRIEKVNIDERQIDFELTE